MCIELPTLEKGISMQNLTRKGAAVLAACGFLAGLLATAGPAARAADIDREFLGLHDGQQVYGFDATSETSPFVNGDNYSIMAAGDVTGSYTNVRYSVFGLYADAAVDLQNSGLIQLTAVGGVPANDFSAYGEMSAFAIVTDAAVDNRGDLTVDASGATINNTGTHAYSRLYAYGIEALGTVTNEGAVTVTATGGTAAATTYAYAGSWAYGIESNTGISNSGDIDASASGGTASASGSDYATVIANAVAEGLRSESSEAIIANSGDVTITASGGDATVAGDFLYNSASATAYAAGVLSESATGLLSNSGDVTVTASGGNAVSRRAYSTVVARALGLDSDGPVDNSGAVAVTAEGGSVTSVYNDGLANAEAYGIASGATVTNDGPVTVSATGGSVNGDDGYARGFAYGIDAGEAVTNGAGGAITVSATGGTAEASDEASAYVEAYGIASDGVVTNNGGTVSVTAQGGSATAGTNRADSYAEAWGLVSQTSVNNSGTVSVTAQGGEASSDNGYAESYAQVWGLSSVGDVSNSGAISAAATGGTTQTASESEYGLSWTEAYGIYSDGAVLNSGDIAATATGGTADAYLDAYAEARACGIRALAGVDNSGAISVAAQGGTASSDISFADHEAEAYGISTEGDVRNSGAISVTSAAGSGISTTGYDTYGYAEASGIEAGGIVDNSGSLSVTATGGQLEEDGYGYVDAEAYGISAGNDVSNSGAISVAATGGSVTSGSDVGYAEAFAYGIDTAGSVVNSGAITTSAQGGTASGALSDADGDAYADAWGIRASDEIVNSGTIAVTATGGTATADSSEPYALAIGLQGGSVDNTGDITATATYGEGTGLDPFSTAFGEAHAGAAGILATGGDVINGGNITVQAMAPDDLDTAAVGILFAADGNLTQNGMIRAFGDRAYEVAVMSGTVTLLDSYHMTLDGDPTVGSLFVNDGATLDINGAALSVSALSGETLFNTEYQIFETEEGSGAVAGAFGAISAVNPSIAVLYHDQATEGSVDDTVSLAYGPAASPQLEAVGLLRQAFTLSSDLVGHRIVTTFLRHRADAGVPRLYAAAGTVAGDAGGIYATGVNSGFFFSPYYANVDKDASPVGYDADLVGFVTGLERHANGNLYGFHVGFGHAGLDFTGNGYSRNQEDQEVLSAGLHLMGSRNNWTWRGQLTGFYGWHDYDGLTGVGLEQRESADYDSCGLRTTLLAGRVFRHGAQLLLPEAGLEYLWLHRESFTTDADDDAWDMRSDAIDEHQLSALASLRWLTTLQAGDVEVTPSLAAGLRFLITDDEIDAHQSIAGSGPVTVRADQDEVTGTVSASLRLRKNQLASELAYGGEFGDETTMHSAWLRFSYLY